MKIFSLLVIAVMSGVMSLPIDDDSQFRWTVEKNGEGKMHMIDLNPVDAEVEPAFIPEDDMFFLLFTRDNPTIGQRITWTSESIANSNFRRGGSVRFLIHGWTSSSNSGENPRTTRELLAFRDHNVIVVDWSVGAAAPNYITARNRVGPAGAVVGRLINFLNQNGYTTLDRVHIIGISLGAHVSGHAGKNVAGGKVAAIFGNDPAGPLFNLDNPDRLDFDDAHYTEGIYTNAGTLGINVPITQASFYPNWGSSQPGCGVDISGNCAHARSTFLYSESINGPPFTSRQCNDHSEIVAQNCPGTGASAILGGDDPKSISGIFFLTTNAESPFSQG